MEKINVVLLLLNRDLFESTLKSLNLDKINLVAVIMDINRTNTEDTDEAEDEVPTFFQLGDQVVALDSFAMLQKSTRSILKNAKSYMWLVNGYLKGSDDLLKLKRYLVANGVPEKNIARLDVNPQFSTTWLANLRYIEKFGADFFATGDEYTQLGLNMDLIPCIDRNKGTLLNGVNLADFHQDLTRGYQTAKYVFKHVKPGTIKFVIIGLAPYSFYYDSTKDFLHTAKGLQYALALNDPTDYDTLMMTLFRYNVGDFFNRVTYKQADVNYNGIRTKIGGSLSAKAIIDWGNIDKTFNPKLLDNNVKILKKYIELCIDNGARPIGVLFSFPSITRKTYNPDIIKVFRKTIRQFETRYDFSCVDMFELKIGYDCYFDFTHLNAKGQIFATTMTSLRMFSRGIIPVDGFLNKDYETLKRLALVAPADEYNKLMSRIFTISAKRIAAKKKIKVGFVMLEAAHWCGKDLYDFFAQNKRFETTVFISMDFHKDINDLVKKNFRDDVEQLKSHGLNVVALEDLDSTVPTQDVLIFLTPYLQYFAKPFQIQNMSPKTLLAYIPYAYDSSTHVKSFYSQMLILVAWRIFFSSTITFDLYKEKCLIGAPGGVYSGYPRMDVFFKEDVQFTFDWKMAQPDAKKIIWAPHHSIGTETSIVYATFQWNYQFMYEFAKDHPETSWVVKPHPWLLYSAVTEGVFESAEAFEAYLQAWNDLPNAKVVIGGYYQDIFATSDAMIHDCGSFIAEYQYVDKPMIYLKRDTQNHNKLGTEILKVSYCVDGKKLEGIAAAIQRVIIDGDDYKAEKRRKLFDKYLNYPQTNGMPASEFIFKTIVDTIDNPPE